MIIKSWIYFSVTMLAEVYSRIENMTYTTLVKEVVDPLFHLPLSYVYAEPNK